MAIEIPILAHPLTLGGDDKPRYTASDFRKANNVFFPPPDNVSGFSCVQGVRASFNGPICSLSDLTVHIRAHSGYLYPFAGESPYTYFIPDTDVDLDNVTSDWKLAITVSDSSVGHGSVNQAYLRVLPYNTPDSSIDGLVLATVQNGAVNDVAPRLRTGTVIETNTFSQLRRITAIDGQEAKVRNSGEYYIMRNGDWSQTAISSPQNVVTSRYGKVTAVKRNGIAQLLIEWNQMDTSSWGSGEFGTLSNDWIPAIRCLFPTSGRDGASQREIILETSGRLWYQNQGASQNGGSLTVGMTYLLQNP